MAQLEAASLRGELQGALPADEAAALRADLRAAQDAAAAAQQQLHAAAEGGGGGGGGEARKLFEEERKQLLGQLSVAREEEARARARLQKLEHIVATGDASAAGVLAERDAELARLTAALARAREDDVLRRQALCRAEVTVRNSRPVEALKLSMRYAVPRCTRLAQM